MQPPPSPSLINFPNIAIFLSRPSPQWSQSDGSRYWCTKKSGGVDRDWVGVPRKLYYPGREPRCACVRTRGPPSTDPGAATDRGDRDSPHLQEYQGCGQRDYECRGVREEK